MTDERLTGLEEIWQDDSHLSGVALVAAADGQDDLLPADALEHLGDCLSCNERLGEQAVLAMVMHESLVASRSSEVPQTAQVSWRLLAASAAALCLALIGSMPVLMGIPDFLASVPALLSGLWRAVQPLSVGPFALVVSSITALVLVLSGWAVARLAPRRVVLRGVG